MKSFKIPSTNSKANDEDDYTEIEILKDIGKYYRYYKEIGIGELEESFVDPDGGYFKVTFHPHDGSLDRQVSSVKIAFPHRKGKNGIK